MISTNEKNKFELTNGNKVSCSIYSNKSNLSIILDRVQNYSFDTIVASSASDTEIRYSFLLSGMEQVQAIVSATLTQIIGSISVLLTEDDNILLLEDGGFVLL